MSSSDEEVDPAVEKLNREFQEAISKRDEANGTFTRTLIGADLSKNTTLEQLLDQSREGSIGLLVLSKKVSKFFTRGYEAGLYIMTADMPSRLRLDPTTCMWEGQPEPLPMERMLCTRVCFVAFGVSARAADGNPGQPRRLYYHPLKLPRRPVDASDRRPSQAVGPPRQGR